MTNLPLTWKADHIRVSLFLGRVISEPIDQIYSAATGLQPTEINQKPTTGESIASGNYEDLRLDIRRAFNRLDIILQAPAPQSLQATVISQTANSIDSLKKIASKFVGDRSELIRVAMAGNFLFEVESPAQGYKKLSELTGNNFDYEKHKDVIFQINVPTLSKTAPGLLINRLTQWSVPTVSIHHINDPTAVSKTFYCGCNADFNTDGENKDVLAAQTMSPLLDELADEMVNFISGGIPL